MADADLRILAQFGEGNERDRLGARQQRGAPLHGEHGGEERVAAGDLPLVKAPALESADDHDERGGGPSEWDEDAAAGAAAGHGGGELGGSGRRGPRKSLGVGGEEERQLFILAQPALVCVVRLGVGVDDRQQLEPAGLVEFPGDLLGEQFVKAFALIGFHGAWPPSHRRRPRCGGAAVCAPQTVLI